MKLTVIMRRIGELKPYARNARTHSKKQIMAIANSIKKLGFNNPILMAADGTILAGHGRWYAAKFLEMEELPTICLSHLSEAEQRAYILADNKHALDAGWDTEILAEELAAVTEFGLAEITGFSLAEIDNTLDLAREASTKTVDAAENEIPELGTAAICRPGEVFNLGRHRLLCGDARDVKNYKILLGASVADMAFVDPPFNVKIENNVSGLGKVRHQNFVMASGEMSEEEFTEFLVDGLGPLATACRDGAIIFTMMDWRHMGELLAAGKRVFTDLKNVIVWNKSNGGMGTFYRSKYELIFVYKVGTAPHTNNFGLGETGRPRTNVWDYPGISSISSTRAEDQAMHPTTKPVSLVADAIRDCSKRGEVILDVFGGSGTTLIAAEKTGRVARVMELDPLYCDTIIRRFEKFTGKQAVLEGSGLTFEEVSEQRMAQAGELAA